MYLDRDPQLRFLFVGDGILREKLQEQIDDGGCTTVFSSPAWCRRRRFRNCSARWTSSSMPAGGKGWPAPCRRRSWPASRSSATTSTARAKSASTTKPAFSSARATGRICAPLMKLAGDPALRERLGQEGRRRFADQFRHETMTRRIRELYEQLLA